MIGRSLATLAVGAALLSSPLVLANDAIPSDLPVAQLLTAANAHLTAGRSQEALNYFDAAISREPENYLTVFKRGAAYLSLGRSAQAERDFDTVLKLKPGFEGALIQRAKIKSRNGLWHSAREDYAAAGKGDGEEVTELKDAEEAVTLATDAEAAGNWDECIAQAGVALRTAPALLPLRNARYRCRLEKGDVESAVSDMQHIMQLSGSTEPHLQISALSFYSLGETDKGLTSIRKCLQSDPDNKECRKLFRREKPIDKRIKQLNVLWERGSFATSVKLLIKTSEDQGLIQDVLDDFEELKKEGIIHAKAPNGLHAQMIERACQAYIELKKYPKAKPFCEAALATDPTSQFGLLSKARQELDDEDFEGAIRTLNEAKEHHETNRVHKMLEEAQMLLRRSKQKDYYKILGVDREEDERGIKRAYRKLAKQYHPDKASAQGITKEEAEKKMAAINEAYETLSDPELRARVDRGEDPNDSTQQGGPFHGSPFFAHGGQQFVFRTGPGGGPGFDGGSFQFQGFPF